MRTKLWHYFKVILALWILFKIFHKCEHRNDGFFNRAFGQAYGTPFFQGDDLDYWREGKKIKYFTNPSVNKETVQPAGAVPSKSIIRQSDTLPFDWKNYDDPKSAEFWDDGGDYVAPRPLREAVANPTEENLAKYLTWQAKRLEVLAVFNAKLANTEASKGKKESSKISSKPIAKPAIKQSSVRLPEVELLYFYQSSCPHCQAEKAHVEDLARRGVRVSFVQMDSDVNPPLHQGSVPYTAKHSAQFEVTATPTATALSFDPKQFNLS